MPPNDPRCYRCGASDVPLTDEGAESRCWAGCRRASDKATSVGPSCTCPLARLSMVLGHAEACALYPRTTRIEPRDMVREQLMQEFGITEEQVSDYMKNYQRTSDATDREVYMVLVGPYGDVFVKALDLFRSQGGFNWEKDPWGKNWKPVVATSVEGAREKGCALPGAKPYERQAK